MSDTQTLTEQVQEDLDVLDLPERSNTANATSRKTLYTAGATTVANTVIDGQETKVFTRFDSARVIRMSIRPQPAKDRLMLVLSTGIILDNFVTGILDEQGNEIIHPLLSDPRFARYLTLPHRVNAQQWMDVDNLPKASEFARYLQERKGFRIDIDPPNAENSQRKTKDLYQVRPINGLNPNNPRAFGAQVDAFEVSVNPNYNQGFSSFQEGLTEQMERWLGAHNETDEELRMQRLESLRNNLHFIGGVYHEEEGNNYWARPVDIGIIRMDDIDFPFYPVQGDNLDDEAAFALLQAREGAADSNTPPDSAPGGALDLPGAPTEAELQDF